MNNNIEQQSNRPGGEEPGLSDNKQEPGKEEQKMAANPNPRANENIQHSPIDKSSDTLEEGVGSEITDGEGG